MLIEKPDIWKNRPCNECHKDQDIKVITIGQNYIALCKECRERLKELIFLDSLI
jgi:hypothetical protein